MKNIIIVFAALSLGRLLLANCEEKFDGVPEAQISELINALGGPKGVKLHLKVARADVIVLTSLAFGGSYNYSPSKKALLKDYYWDRKELSEKKTRKALLSDDIEPVVDNKFQIDGVTTYEFGFSSDLGGSDRRLVSIGSVSEGISQLIDEHNFTGTYKAFTNRLDMFFLVNVGTGESFRFKLKKRSARN